MPSLVHVGTEALTLYLSVTELVHIISDGEVSSDKDQAARQLILRALHNMDLVTVHLIHIAGMWLNENALGTARQGLLWNLSRNDAVTDDSHSSDNTR